MFQQKCVRMPVGWNDRCSAFSRGDAALEKYPHLSAEIANVKGKDGSFSLPDIGWIADILGQTVRVTIAPASHALASQFSPNLPQDFICGNGAVSVHLWFEWQEAVAEQRSFGHFDLLLPTCTSTASVHLPPDAP